MKSSIRSLSQIFAICLIVLQAPRVIAFIPPPPDPGPTVGPTVDPTPPPETDVRTTATFYFSDGTQVSAQCRNGRFRPVGLHLNEVINVTVSFPAGWTNASLAIQALDGGNLSSSANTAVAADGTASLRFQVGNLAGLYRIAVIGAGGPSILQFWVADANNPRANLPVLNPEH